MHEESVSIRASLHAQYACHKASSSTEWYSQKKYTSEGGKGKYLIHNVPMLKKLKQKQNIQKEKKRKKKEHTQSKNSVNFMFNIPCIMDQFIKK
jgi:hypothetical protein